MFLEERGRAPGGRHEQKEKNTQKMKNGKNEKNR